MFRKLNVKSQEKFWIMGWFGNFPLCHEGTSYWSRKAKSYPHTKCHCFDLENLSHFYNPWSFPLTTEIIYLPWSIFFSSYWNCIHCSSLFIFPLKFQTFKHFSTFTFKLQPKHIPYFLSSFNLLFSLKWITRVTRLSPTFLKMRRCKPTFKITSFKGLLPEERVCTWRTSLLFPRSSMFLNSKDRTIFWAF